MDLIRTALHVRDKRSDAAIACMSNTNFHYYMCTFGSNKTCSFPFIFYYPIQYIHTYIHITLLVREQHHPITTNNNKSMTSSSETSHSPQPKNNSKPSSQK